MGSFILRGITTALLVTVLTLFAGIVWGVMDLGGLSISKLLDIGLLASCLVGGYRTAKESGVWLLGGIVGAGFVTVGTLLLALFLPVRGWGFIQVLAEGVIIGLVAGAVGAGGVKGKGKSAWSGNKSIFAPSYVGYEAGDDVNDKFEWDKVEEVKEWKEVPITDWIASSESNLKGGLKRDYEKSPDIQWPWDWEEEKKIDLGPGYLEPMQLEPLKISTSTNTLGGAKPWWEGDLCDTALGHTTQSKLTV